MYIGLQKRYLTTENAFEAAAFETSSASKGQIKDLKWTPKKLKIPYMATAEKLNMSKGLLI